MPESELGKYHSTQSSMKSGFEEEYHSTQSSMKSGFEEEYDSTQSSMKSGSNNSDLLGECFQPYPFWEKNVCGTSCANENWSEGKHSEKEENPSSPFEEENTSSSFEEHESTSSPLEHQYNIAQLVQELTNFKKTQAERNNYLEQKLITAELEIQLLKDCCTLLESTRRP